MMPVSRRDLSFIAPTLYFLITLVTWISLGALERPQDDPDAVFFEILAANIAEFNEFSGELRDTVVGPYLKYGMSEALEPGKGGYALEIQNFGLNGINSYRPPLYPYLLAGIYKIFGRSFFWQKIINLTFIALGIGVIVRIAHRVGSIRMAWAAMIISLCDPSSMFYAKLGTTEAISFLGVSLLLYFVSWGRLSESTPVTYGIGIGLLGLCKHVFFLWIPFLLVALFPRCSIRSRVTFLVVCVLVLLPWGIRNSLLLNTFAPLGSQGGVILGMIYNDKTLSNGGNWTHEVHRDYTNEMARVSVENKERYLLDLGSKRFNGWISENYQSFPILMIKRAVSLWWTDAMNSQRVLVILSLLGSFFVYREPWARYGLIFCGAHTLAIALTCNITRYEDLVCGRYLFSLQPILILLAASLVDHLRFKSKRV